MYSFRNIWRKTFRHIRANSSASEVTSPFAPLLKSCSNSLLQSQRLVDHTACWHWLQSLRLLAQPPHDELGGAGRRAFPSPTASAVETAGWKAKLVPDLLQSDFPAAWGCSQSTAAAAHDLGLETGEKLPFPASSPAVHGTTPSWLLKKGKPQQLPGGRGGQTKKAPLPRSIVQVLDTGMRPGMMPQTRGPVASSYGDASKLEQLNKVWHRRGLGRNKVLPGATWSLRRLKLDRAEASKLERQHRASIASEHTNLNCFAPLVCGVTDVLESNVVARILASRHNAQLSAKLFEWAKQQQWHRADARTYAELIRIMAWAGEADAAEELLQEMNFLVGTPDGDTFLVVLLVYYRTGRLAEAIRVLRDALKLGYQPDRKIVRITLYLCLKCGTASEQALLHETLMLNRHLIGPADDLENRLSAVLCRNTLDNALQ